ncbi:MAG: hypothetical protein KBF74_12115 [Ferruginibacter sp.]|jgi:hypothetical protein|nr:hypothetical protein [Ferruginibacter sp.]
MKRISVIQSISLFLVVMFMFASVFQCRKEGDLIKNLDRSFTGTKDSAIYAAFYESNTVSPADATPDVNDVIKFRGVQTIIHEYCGTSNCHGGPIAPKFDTYSEIMRYVAPGNPESSKLWNYLTTNDFDEAMPPVNSNHEMTITDKTLIYNWIANGAKERPDLNDFRPAAISLIVNGCGSANCHNQATATGGWARKGLIPGLTSADTTQFTYINPVTGAVTLYCQLSNETLRDQVWTAYKDSVKKFYSDTIAFASYRPWKTFATPRSALSTRGPLQNYDDILMDIMYPKSARSNSSVQYTNPTTLVTYYVKGNYLNVSSSMVSRVDSTVVLANPFTGVFATNHQGDMAYGDGGLKPHEVALIKAWYFADPNIPLVWKYGNANAGIFKYRKTGNIIRQ